MFAKGKNKWLITLIHFLLWILIILVPMFLFQPRNRSLHLSSQAYGWVFLISIFYLNYALMIPRLLFTRKVLVYGLVITAILLASYYFTYYVPGIRHLEEDIRMTNPNISEEELMHMAQGAQNGRAFFAVMSSFLFLAIGTSIKVTEQWYVNEKQRKEMETQKLEAELSFLKQQINPHFFFNTLNSIYSLSTRKSEKTPEAIIKLSLLMRYIIYESDKPIVPLQKELDYINNYVELQKLRFRDDVKITYSIEGETTDIYIEPLLLLPFIENAFKHGIDYSNECFIFIHVQILDNKLQLVVENPLVKKQQVLPAESSGIGLTNSRKRLQLLYPGMHELNITEEDNTFRAELVLKLKQHDVHHS